MHSYGLRVSKYKIWFENQSYPDDSECYITDRSLFYQDLDRVIEDSEKTLAHYGQKMYEEKSFGYQCYDLKKHIKLQLLRDSLLRHRMQIQYADLGVKPCLDDRRIQKTIEEAKKLIIYSCCKTAKKALTVDSSGKEEWLKKNPYCVGREKWEKLAYKVCNDIKIRAKSVDKTCDLAYVITNEENNCSLQYAIDSYSKNCDIDFKVTYKEWEDSGCRTSYKDCKKLNKCGISFDHIIEMQKCGIKTKYDTKNNCPEISYKGTTVNFDTLEVGKDFDPDKACKIIDQFE